MTENTTQTPEVEGEPTSKRTLILAGAGAGVLVLGAAGFLLLHGGGSSTDSASGLVPTHHKPVVHSTTAKGAAQATSNAAVKPAALPAVSTIRIGRDPFKALYVIPVAAPVAAAETGTTPAGTSTGTATGTAPVVTTYPLKFTKVSGKTAFFVVNGKAQLAKQGSVFGRTQELKLLSFEQDINHKWVAVVQVGDAEPVDLHMGETISVM